MSGYTVRKSRGKWDSTSYICSFVSHIIKPLWKIGLLSFYGFVLGIHNWKDHPSRKFATIVIAHRLRWAIVINTELAVDTRGPQILIELRYQPQLKCLALSKHFSWLHLISLDCVRHRKSFFLVDICRL